MRQMDLVDPRTARSTSVHSFLLVLCFRRPRSSRGAATEPANKYRRRSIIKLAGRRFAAFRHVIFGARIRRRNRKARGPSETVPSHSMYPVPSKRLKPVPASCAYLGGVRVAYPGPYRRTRSPLGSVWAVGAPQYCTSLRRRCQRLGSIPASLAQSVFLLKTVVQITYTTRGRNSAHCDTSALFNISEARPQCIRSAASTPLYPHNLYRLDDLMFTSNQG
ncbi:hypothetical protein B0H15DRAFT_467124 [Mycena belliarum]|uniref:Uncharacterized protein n=1 Tax=Mycena belliarum TaxID=1033014 RepID=A0AAD6XIK7_9AGAR|nr:hypothetical protein B0H15DRAFT_467124 [Mycena belliae]